MSERVLTGPLIDFGTSFWKSPLVRSEYPGLQGKFRDPRGRYGIGFFSIFMWANEVTVATRPFGAGKAETKLLRFRSGLGQRPILQSASPTEMLGRASTRIHLKVPKSTVARMFNKGQADAARQRLRYIEHYETDTFSDSDSPWTKLVSLLSGLLEIKVYVEEGGKETLANLPDWRSTSSERFVAFVQMLAPQTAMNTSTAAQFSEQLSFVRSGSTVVGRALVQRESDDRDSDDPRRLNMGLLIYEKGIFVTDGRNSISFGGRRTNVLGAIEGRATRASREVATFFEPWSDREWVAEQERRIFAGVAHLGDRLAAQQALIHIGTLNENEPMFVLNRDVVSLVTLKERIHTAGEFEIRLEESHRAEFQWKAPESLSIITGIAVNARRVYPLVNFEGQFLETFDLIEYLNNDYRIKDTETGHAFNKVMQQLIDILGGRVSVKKEFSDRNSYSKTRYMDLLVQRAGA